LDETQFNDGTQNMDEMQMNEDAEHLDEKSLMTKHKTWMK